MKLMQKITARGEDMSKKYPDLDTLIKDDQEANQYFKMLPDYVKDQIKQRSHHVNSLASLQDYAENLLRGDD